MERPQTAASSRSFRMEDNRQKQKQKMIKNTRTSIWSDSDDEGPGSWMDCDGEEETLSWMKDDSTGADMVTISSKDTFGDDPSYVHNNYVRTGPVNTVAVAVAVDTSISTNRSLIEATTIEADNQTHAVSLTKEDLMKNRPSSFPATISNLPATATPLRSGSRYERIRDENKRLKEEVYRIKEESREKDSLISTLESQVMALILANRETNNNNSNTNDVIEEDDIISVVSEHSDGENDNTFRTTNNRMLATMIESSRDRRSAMKDKMIVDILERSQDLSTITGSFLLNSTPASSVAPSLNPPRRSSIEVRHALAPPIKKPCERPCLVPSTSRRNCFQKSTAAIRALPRELSISNHHSHHGRGSKKNRRANDEGSSFSENDRVENIEIVDAYYARGYYTGTIDRVTQMPHGKGKMVYHRGGRVGGRFYDGDWHLGHWHGHGILRESSGDIYEGQIVNDLKEGIGTIQFTDGRIFEGNFVQDEASEGTVSYIDGAQYVGELHHGHRHGLGIYRFSDGSYYEGRSVMNRFEGKGRMTWSDCGFYAGDWSKGEMHGFGQEYRPDGSLRHDGRWIKGRPLHIKKTIHNRQRNDVMQHASS